MLDGGRAMKQDVSVDILKDKVLTEIGVCRDQDEIYFKVSDKEIYLMHHYQSCCESVVIEDICGNFEDLIGSPILIAEERCNYDSPEGQVESRDMSETWTFYEFATLKGSVTIRWYGTSNGYYSESVNFERIF